MSKTWKPHDKLTEAPTNLKEAIDWVLRVTGRDGKENKAAQPPPPASPPQLACLCYLAKAVKDLLYDARSPGSPGPSQGRYWDDILLTEESDIVKPVLTDLGLLSGSTSAASSTCSGGTEVIKALIDQLAEGLQKWVGWQEGDKDICCLKGTDGIGKGCDCPGGGGGAGCCTGGGSDTASASASHECKECGNNGTPGSNVTNKCYLSSYQGVYRSRIDNSIVTEAVTATWTRLSSDGEKVHLLARIFLGSVCLIWSGLSQLGFLTGGSERWDKSSLHDIETGDNKGLGSFMAAMGYDLERLNQGTGPEKKGEDVWKLLSGTEPGEKKNKIKWQEFASVKSNTGSSVAEYYSSIYEKAKSAAKGSSKNTESICKQYPLLVLHILASGYFRAGSAGAKGIIPAPSAPKPVNNDAIDSASKKPRHPRTIREILYWLSALPYSEKYRELVERMDGKMKGILPKEDQKKQYNDTIELHGEGISKTYLKKDCITHYLMAACGYCPLVLIGIQGTIEREVVQATASGGAGGVAGADKKKCPKHKDNPHKRCDPKNIKEPGQAAAAATSPGAPTGKPLEKGQVCYGGYHLAVKDFGPLHGMYANGLFGFQMDTSPAQCLDQLRIYVYHCFYQLYFLRKQSMVAVLGWKSCRYGSGVGSTGATRWICQTKGTGNNGNEHTKNCGLQSGAGSGTGSGSPLMAFLCDTVTGLHCGKTKGVDLASGKQDYPSIEDHLEAKDTSFMGHLGKPPKHCPVPMGWSKDITGSGANRENHFKDLTQGTHKTDTLTTIPPGSAAQKYPAHCTGRTLSYLLEYYCDPGKSQQGTLVVLLRLLACITPTVPRTLGDLFGFYYYIVYIGGKQGGGGGKEVHDKLGEQLKDVRLSMLGSGGKDAVVKALCGWRGAKQHGDRLIRCSNDCKSGDLISLVRCTGKGSGDDTREDCGPYLCPLSGQQYGQLSPAMAGTYLSWLVYLIGEFKTGLEGLKGEFQDISCKDSECKGAGNVGCGSSCTRGTHGDTQKCCGCTSVVSCTGVLPVLYKYGFGYGDSAELGGKGTWSLGENKRQCKNFLCQLNNVIGSEKLKELTNSINQLIYTTRLPWIFVLTLAWLVAVLYLAFGAIWPLDWTHMRSHCRGWFRKGSLSPWEVLMVGKKKGSGILEFFGPKKCHDFLGTLGNVEASTEFQKLTTSINQLIYTTRLPWIFVLTIAFLVAVLYLAFGAIWPLDWAHMRSHCRGWFRKGSLSPWEVLMVGKKKGRGILEFFGGK